MAHIFKDDNESRLMEWRYHIFVNSLSSREKQYDVTKTAKTDEYKTNPEHPGRPTIIELFVGIGGGQEAADPQH